MAKKRRLRIASYNINGINTRIHVLTRWLEEFQPDIVGLQELKCTDEAFPAEAIEALGYGAIWHGQKSWNGVAILSRVGEPVETRRGLPNDPTTAKPLHRGGDRRDPHRQPLRAQRQSVARAQVRLQARAGWTGSRPRRDAARQRCSRRCSSATSTSSRPSTTSTSPSAGPRTRCSRRRRGSSSRSSSRQGWTDALRHLHPDERIYTFWHYWRNAFQRDAGIRIDHALLSPALAKSLKAAGVDRTPRGWEKTSDHAPMWIDLDVP